MITYFKRWTSGLVSRVDSIIVQIENQEALVDSAIADMSQRVARAKVQLGRVDKDGQALAKRAEYLAKEQGVWRDRARTEPDRVRALECLRRSKRAAQQHAELEQRALSHRESEQRLRRDISLIQQKLEQLREQRNTMRTRQTRAEAMAVLQSAGSAGGLEIEQILERWDARVTEAELVAGLNEDDHDAFATDFEQEEERAQLLAELEELKREEQHDRGC